MKNEAELTDYETLFILRTEQGGKVKEFLNKYKKIIEDLSGTVIHVEEWGNRELAYPIQKQFRGNYNLMRYRASGGTVKELERTMKLSEEVMRCLTVRLDEDAEPPSAQGPKESAPSTSSERKTDRNESEPES